MENNLKEIENYFELTEGSSYNRRFELPGIDCATQAVVAMAPGGAV